MRSIRLGSQRMKIHITSVADLGLAVRAFRKEEGLRLDDTAGSAGVGHVFLREMERGKDTVQLGRVLKVLDELGIHLSIDIPDRAAARLNALQKTGLKPLPSRKSSAAKPTGTGDAS